MDPGADPMSTPKPFYRQKPKTEAEKAVTRQAAVWSNPRWIAKHPADHSTETLLQIRRGLRKEQRGMTERLAELSALLADLEAEIAKRKAEGR
jgi:hypothetical protein